MNNVLVGKRKKKSIWLDEGTIDLVTTYAEIHNLNFSRTIESLALLGLQDTKALGNAWAAFNIAGGSRNTLAAHRQKATLDVAVELREYMRSLMRIVLALTAGSLQIPHTSKTDLQWNMLTEATGIATEKPHVLVEQLLDALGRTLQASAKTHLQEIHAEQFEENRWAAAALEQFQNSIGISDVETE